MMMGIIKFMFLGLLWTIPFKKKRIRIKPDPKGQIGQALFMLLQGNSSAFLIFYKDFFI